MKNNILEHRPRAILEVPSSGGSALSNPPQHAFRLSKSYCMSFQGHDIKSNLFVVAAGATLLATAAFAIRHFFRTFTWRKDPSVGFSNRYGTSELAIVNQGTPASAVAPPLSATLAPVTEPASAQASDDVTQETSPIDPSEATPLVTMLASEAVLRRDWDSPEEDEAWAHL
jgi:hypothetical protein